MEEDHEYEGSGIGIGRQMPDKHCDALNQDKITTPRHWSTNDEKLRLKSNFFNARMQTSVKESNKVSSAHRRRLKQQQVLFKNSLASDKDETNFLEAVDEYQTINDRSNELAAVVYNRKMKVSKRKRKELSKTPLIEYPLSTLAILDQIEQELSNFVPHLKNSWEGLDRTC